MTQRAAPLISVVIPTFNSERYIMGAIASVLRQSYRNVEVLVIDDGSTDRTCALVADVGDPRVRLFEQEHGGPAAARNAGVTIAGGEYVAFLDADDRWLSDKLAVDLATLALHDHRIAIVYSWFYCVDDNGTILNRSAARDFSNKGFEALLRHDNILIPSAVTLHRSIFDAVGAFALNCNHEDHKFILRACKDFPIYATRRRNVVYRRSVEGRCRALLKDAANATAQELGTVQYLRPHISDEQHALLYCTQMRSLVCSFLMYGFFNHAKRLYRDTGGRALRKGIKGWIAWISLLSGLNILLAIRLIVQSVAAYFEPACTRNEIAALYRLAPDSNTLPCQS